jgi:hypothetical protein
MLQDKFIIICSQIGIYKKKNISLIDQELNGSEIDLVQELLDKHEYPTFVIKKV